MVSQIGFTNGLNIMGLRLSLQEMHELYQRPLGADVRDLCGSCGAGSACLREGRSWCKTIVGWSWRKGLKGWELFEHFCIFTSLWCMTGLKSGQ